MFISHIRQKSDISDDIVELLSKCSISVLDEQSGFVEITPRDQMDSNYLRSNLGNSLSEVSEYFNKFHGMDNVQIKSHAKEGRREGGITVSRENKRKRKEVYLGYLNSMYTFESFIVGESNEFASGAAMGAATRPGTHNPLFITGQSGLGKTHLMNAIGNEFAERNPKLNICSLSSEELTNIVVEHISGRNTNLLRQKLRRKCDLLMIDDIQFLEGKDSTISEFFHTFNTLYEAGKQIVVTSDRAPEEMGNFEERITSRFMWGAVAHIRPPDVETRAAIVKKKAEERDIDIPQGVIEMVSEKVKNNVRELEGALTKLVIQAQSERKPIDIRMASVLLKTNGAAGTYSASLRSNGMDSAMIKATVEGFFSLNSGLLESNNKTKAVAFPRQIAMFLMKKHMDMPYISIGEEFGDRDHSTVIYSVSKIEKAISEGDGTTISALKEIEDRMRI